MRTKTPLSISTRRGAARVSAVWMIVVIVLLLVALGYAYIAQDDAASAQSRAVAATNDKVAAENLVEVETAAAADRYEILGFTTDFATIPSNVETAKAALEATKAVFPDMAAADTFEKALPLMTQAYQAKLAQIAELEKTIATKTAQIASERSAMAELESSKDAIIATLTQEKGDIEDSLKSEITRLETATSEQRNQIESKTNELTKAEDAKRLADRALEETKKAAASQNANHTRQRNDILKSSEKPDGEISAVLSAFDMGIINLAASDRLSEGIVFKVISGQPGADITKPKALCRVTNVGTKFSEVEIFDVADPLGQPVVAGDKIYNSLYEAKGQRNAVFAGNISGAYNKPELLLLFEEIGINVQDELSNTTDFLIVGGPMFMDEEGEPLEEPLQPESLPIYADASARGITVIPVRDILQFFRR